MATILERNQKNKLPKKTTSDHAEDALYREVWEDVNNEKTQAFVKKYSKYLITGAIVILILVTSIQLLRHNNNSARIATVQNYETIIESMDTNALAALAKNTSGATADLALFQSYMLDNDVKKLELLSSKGDTRDFRDLAKIHLAGINGDAMDAAEFEKFLSSTSTKSSPFYYTSMLMIAQKYLASGNKITANIWLDKIINDPAAPAVVSGTAQSLK